MNSVAPTKPRVGCLGCLVKAVLGVIPVLVFGLIVVAG